MGVTTVDELFLTAQEIDPRFFQRPNRNSTWQHGHWPITKPPSADEFFLWTQTIQEVAARVSEDPTILDRNVPPSLPTPGPSHLPVDITADGGVKDGEGCFGVVIRHDSTVTYSTGRVPPSDSPMCSYRCELGGVLRGLTEARALSSGPITVCCDNDAALGACSKLVEYRDGDRDLRLAIDAISQTTTLHLQKVKGHADRDKPPHELTKWERDNVTADRLATMALTEQLEGRTINDLQPPNVPGQIRFNGIVQPTMERNSLYRLFAEPSKKDQLMTMFEFSQDDYDKIRFDYLRWTQQKNSNSLRRWLFKISNKAAPTRRRRYVRKQIDNDKCLFCGNVDTSFHCLACPAHRTDRQYIWNQFLNKVKDVDDTGALGERLRNFFRGEPDADDRAQWTLGVPATMVGLWTSSFGLDPTDRSFKKDIVHLMQAMQTTLRQIYTHHVTQTFAEEHRKDGDALDEHIREVWDTCLIPADQTKYHPTHTDVETLLGQSYNVRRLWMDLQTSFTNHQTTNETNHNHLADNG